jgi:replicative DNA helicase
MNLQDLPNTTESIHAEQSVIGALLLDNDALYRIPELEAAHFYRHEHRTIFAEMRKQIGKGLRCDIFTLFDAIQHQVPDCLPYLNQVAQSVGSAANISRYAGIVIDRALKRSLMALGGEMQEIGAEESTVLIDRFATKLEALAQKKTVKEPKRLSEMLSGYVETIQNRMEGKIKPIATGFTDLDAKLGGGFNRGTLIVVAGRPAMGKTALGLCLARNAAEAGSALFLSMEMAEDEVNDRNISALGKMPLSWLRNPSDDTNQFNHMTHAFMRSNDLNLYIDDQTGLNMFEIRNKARSVKRKQGLDVLVIDQLSFITGATSEKQWEAVGEYTRGLLALAKELNIVVVLLCQLNRDLEKRQNRRPQLSDLAMSGSIEQDANTILFLYRDEVYNPDSMDKGVCEIIVAKQRQGSPGTVGLAYIGEQTRFEDLANWQPKEDRPQPRSRGFE